MYRASSCALGIGDRLCPVLRRGMRGSSAEQTRALRDEYVCVGGGRNAAVPRRDGAWGRDGTVRWLVWLEPWASASREVGVRRWPGRSRTFGLGV